jgi:hypothetical protein
LIHGGDGDVGGEGDDGDDEAGDGDNIHVPQMFHNASTIS